MQSRHRKNFLRNPKMEGGVPSLLELCIRTAIDNVRYLGDVGATDEDLLARILPHCNVDQLTTIENSTRGRDLSPITDKLWQGFYKKEFGSHNFDEVIERMEKRKVSYNWKELYEAKLEELEEAQQRSFARIKNLYIEAGSRKQSRQVQPTSKIPPTSNKRTFYGGPGSLNIANTKSGIMKKAKLEFLNSNEMKNLAAVKKNTVQKRPIIPAIRKQAASSSSSSSKFSASTSKFCNSMGRRY